MQVKGTGAFGVSLFPNPTVRGFTYVRSSSPDVYNNVLVHIVDGFGNSIYQQTFAAELLRHKEGHKLLASNQLSPGLYFVIIKQGESRVQKKLLVS